MARLGGDGLRFVADLMKAFAVDRRVCVGLCIVRDGMAGVTAGGFWEVDRFFGGRVRLEGNVRAVLTLLGARDGVVRRYMLSGCLGMRAMNLSTGGGLAGAVT